MEYFDIYGVGHYGFPARCSFGKRIKGEGASGFLALEVDMTMMNYAFTSVLKQICLYPLSFQR